MSAVRPLPVYVEPAADEALISWLSRLATRLDVSLSTLIEHVLNVKIPASQSGWWQRLHPWQFPRMRQITAVSVARLREMTFIDWSAPSHHDDTPDRFSAARYRARACDPLTHHFAVCPQCLAEDAQPYLRLEWTLGWIAVCPQHALALITRCPQCRAKLRLPSPRSRSTFSALLCSKCHTPFSPIRHHSAHRKVMHMQAALIAAKRSGSGELALLGNMTWPQLLVLTDSLLKIFWTVITPAERHHLLSWIQYDLCVPLIKDPGRWRERYESLAIVTWLLDVPRYNTGVRLTTNDLAHWLTHHAYPVLDDESRALLQVDAMPASLQVRLKDLISLLAPFRYLGHSALRPNIPAPARALGSSPSDLVTPHRVIGRAP
jgi:hypothetical protein